MVLLMKESFTIVEIVNYLIMVMAYALDIHAIMI